MNGKFFDIPFRTLTAQSDFTCPDGEVATATNVSGLSSSGENIDSSSFTDLKDYPAFPPSPEVNFALVRSVLPGWHLLPDLYPTKTVVTERPGLESWTAVASSLFSRFKTEAWNNDLFVMPFYAAAVWKTYDGAYLSPSNPVLMIPNSDVPLIATDGDTADTELDMKVVGALCNLHFKVKTSEALRDWKERIESLTILRSEPLQRYDSVSSFLPIRRATVDSYCESMDPATGVVAKRTICTQTLPLAWRANRYGKLGADDGEEYEGKTFYPFASVKFGNVDLAGDWINLSAGSGLVRMAGNAEGIKYKSLTGGQGSDSRSETVQFIGTGNEVRIITRPLKLGGASLLKRVISIHLRGNYTPSKLSMAVYASRDMIKWWKVAKREGGTVVVLPRSPFRFFKLKITGRLEVGENLQGFSVVL